MMTKQVPNSMRATPRDDVRTQYSALCYRIRRGKPEILLITSRGSGRWIVPKGWPIDGLSPAASAAQEAWEEAGVGGDAQDHCLGLFSYSKSNGSGAPVPCVAMVYPLRVKSLAPDYPEKGQRRRKWFSPKKAAARVSEPELARILREFDPTALR